MACAKFYGQVVFGIIVLKFIYIAAVIHIAVIAVITVAKCMDTSYLMIVCWWAARPNFEAVINEAAASIICQCKCTYLLAPLFCFPPQALKKIRQNRRVLTFSGSYCHVWVSCQFSLMAFISVRKFLFSLFYGVFMRNEVYCQMLQRNLLGWLKRMVHMGIGFKY